MKFINYFFNKTKIQPYKILITGGNGNIAKIIIKNLSSIYTITALSKDELNILNYDEIKNYLDKNNFDILIHTAIIGGRRTKNETADIVYKNLQMFENLLKFSNKFKMIINLDSGAIYDRNTNIMNRKEDELYTIPNDYYGFSKYCIYQRSCAYNNIYNFRIFNLFHVDEENDRFIKKCFKSREIIIFEDKYFDFFYELDFIKVLQYYINNINNQKKLEKTINLSYSQKYKLSEIAEIILYDPSKIKIIKIDSNNYCGDSTKLESLNLKLLDLVNSLIDYKSKLNLDL